MPSVERGQRRAMMTTETGGFVQIRGRGGSAADIRSRAEPMGLEGGRTLGLDVKVRDFVVSGGCLCCGVCETALSVEWKDGQSCRKGALASRWRAIERLPGTGQRVARGSGVVSEVWWRVAGWWWWGGIRGISAG